jgi:hypothetical protein
MQRGQEMASRQTLIHPERHIHQSKSTLTHANPLVPSLGQHLATQTRTATDIQQESWVGFLRQVEQFQSALCEFILNGLNAGTE